MGTKLFYFTGTGNTLWVGKELRDRLPGAELLPLIQLAGQDEIVLEGVVGFLFPLYYLGLPEIVYRVASRADLGRCEYVFGLATCGAFAFAVTGGAQKMGQALDAAPHERRKALDAFFYVWMPGNHLLGYGAYPRIVQKAQLKLATLKIARIARRIQARAAHVERGNPLTAALTRGVYQEWIAKLTHADRAYWVDPRCNSCGLCERVCPVDNILLEAGKPVWRGHCQQCMACIQLCPQQAIQYGDQTVGRKRYRNPEIRVREIIGQKRGA